MRNSLFWHFSTYLCCYRLIFMLVKKDSIHILRLKLLLLASGFGSIMFSTLDPENASLAFS